MPNQLDSLAIRRVHLNVQSLDGIVLRDGIAAHRADFRLSVDLYVKVVVVDLYGHYLRFLDSEGQVEYANYDFASYTYVKFGECHQVLKEFLIRMRFI